MSKDAELVLMHPSADAGTRSYVNFAQQSLDKGNAEMAQNQFFDAKEHLERMFTDVENSVHSIQR